MAQHRSHFPKDAQAHQFTRVRSDLSLRYQGPGSYENRDGRSPLEQHSTVPQPGLADNTSNKAVRKMQDINTEQRQSNTNVFTSPATPLNWNDIPDDMLRAPSRGRKPKKVIAMSKARNAGIQAWKAMYGSLEGFPDQEIFESMDHIAETPPPKTPKKLALHRVEKIEPSPHVRRFKMRNSVCTIRKRRYDSADDVDQESPECKTGDTECVGENVDIHQDSGPSDIEDIIFEEIGASVVVQDPDRLVAERESPSNLDQSNAGNDVDELSENKHKPPKSHEAAPSIQGHLSTEDDFTEHNYLKARAAAGEPTILPRDMLDRLREKVIADEERRRKGDPRYQHEIMLAKVNAAQAKREADVPNDVLYPEANDKRAHGEKCFLDMEQWDLLEEFEVQDQPDQEDGQESMTTLRPEYKAGGNEGLPSDVSISSAAPSKFGTIYGWASKAGNVFASKRVLKESDGPKPVDHQKNGWTLADVLEEDEAIFRK